MKRIYKITITVHFSLTKKHYQRHFSKDVSDVKRPAVSTAPESTTVTFPRLRHQNIQKHCDSYLL